MNNYAELIEFYNKPVLIGKPDADKYLIMAAQMMAEEEMNPLKRRRKPKENPFADLVEMFNTPVPAVREEEVEIKEEKMNCALCGKQLDVYNEKLQRYEHPECGRPLIDGVVCKDCKVKCRNYEDAVKASYPNSIRYYPTSGDVESE